MDDRIRDNRLSGIGQHCVECDPNYQLVEPMTHKRSEGVAPNFLPSDKYLEFRRNSRDSNFLTPTRRVPYVIIHDRMPTCSFAVKGVSTLRSIARGSLTYTVDMVRSLYAIMEEVKT